MTSSDGLPYIPDRVEESASPRANRRRGRARVLASDPWSHLKARDNALPPQRSPAARRGFRRALPGAEKGGPYQPSGSSSGHCWAPCSTRRIRTVSPVTW